ncbi:MAG: hypothetical protein FGM14_16540 [Flavobacteriales bacterium]|nr:hypothetical protein [Flavobacteriales bacterium]
MNDTNNRQNTGKIQRENSERTPTKNRPITDEKQPQNKSSGLSVTHVNYLLIPYFLPICYARTKTATKQPQIKFPTICYARERNVKES